MLPEPTKRPVPMLGVRVSVSVAGRVGSERAGRGDGLRSAQGQELDVSALQPAFELVLVCYEVVRAICCAKLDGLFIFRIGP